MQSSSRNGAKVRLLAIHTTEGILRVNDLRNWSKWPGSSHATADQYGGFLDGPGDGFVDYSRASWTLRSGNPVSDNIELCGFAKWTRAEWLARPKLLESASLWLARRKKARPDIPLVKLTPEQVRAGRAGVIGHNDWTVGMKDGSHWDPGPGFPWDVVLARANALASNTPGSPITTLPVQEDDMFGEDDRTIIKQIRDVLGANGGLNTNTKDSVAYLVRQMPASVAAATLATPVERVGADGKIYKVPILQEIADAKSAALRAEGRQVDDVDEAAIAAQLAAPLVDAVTAHLTTFSVEQLREQVTAMADEIDRRDRERLNQPT